jgi:hypothetical protein
MSSQHQQQIAREVAQYWKGILVTLKQRGLLKQAKRSTVPQVDAVLLEDRAVFVLDMQRLGGISREAWLDQDLWRQWRATLQGRRVFVSDGGGLAITVARRPGPPKKKLPEVITLQEEHLVDAPYQIAAGLDVRRREIVVLNLAGEHRAMLIGGYTGSGKTNLMRSIVVQLAARHPADEMQVAIVDTKEVDFAGPFDRIPQLFQTIARDRDDAEALIERVEGERIRRKAAMARGGVSDWRKLPDPPPLLVLMIDEAADFTATSTMDTLVQIARKGRAFGVSLVVSTQYPTKRVIDAQVRANLTTAIAFPTTTATESRVIINRTGAEHLRQKGRCLTFLDGRWREIQTFFVAQGTLEALLGLSEAEPDPVLPALHVDLVRYAIEELGGFFTITALYDRFGDEVSKYRIEKLAKSWERRGWLEPPSYDDNGRKQSRQVAPELQAIALNTSLRPLNTPSEGQTEADTTDKQTRQDPPPGGGGDGELPSFLVNRPTVEELAE